MTFDSLIVYLQATPAVLAAALPIAAALIGLYFGLIEHYCKKAFYDYYSVPDYARDGFRVRFSPDYALYGLGVVCFAVTAWFMIPFTELWQKALTLMSIGAIVAGVLACWLFKLFLRGENDVTEGWSRESLNKGALVFGEWASVTWVAGVGSYAMAWFLAVRVAHLPEVIALAICVITCGVALPLLVYNWAKAAVPLWHKTLELLPLDEDSPGADVEGFAVLAAFGDLLYCVKAKVVEPNVVVELDCSHSRVISLAESGPMTNVRFGNAVVKGIPTPPSGYFGIYCKQRNLPREVR